MYNILKEIIKSIFFKIKDMKTLYYKISSSHKGRQQKKDKNLWTFEEWKVKSKEAEVKWTLITNNYLI